MEGPPGVVMGSFDRRAFLGASAGALSVLPFSRIALAQTLRHQRSAAVPAEPADRRLRVAPQFRNLPQECRPIMGLAGVVSMTYVHGKYGEFPAGNLFLFPWLNKKGQALGAAKDWQTVMPTSLTKIHGRQSDPELAAAARRVFPALQAGGADRRASSDSASTRRSICRIRGGPGSPTSPSSPTASRSASPGHRAI